MGDHSRTATLRFLTCMSENFHTKLLPYALQHANKKLQHQALTDSATLHHG